ncbi:TetR/AcrR family transcriptional regulator [Mycobacterium sp.]|uniref:TetR/AcrR family transcriptional regulator n=1 Tax=Mycobacterium sp. TaxID=1785 RepID=UPI0039C9B4CF
MRTAAIKIATLDVDLKPQILAAAERCVERHGIRKTTMDDVASEVGLSRPSVYRYFADRDDLLIELITRHSRELIGRAHKSISRQPCGSDRRGSPLHRRARPTGPLTRRGFAVVGRRLILTVIGTRIECGTKWSSMRLRRYRSSMCPP